MSSEVRGSDSVLELDPVFRSELEENLLMKSSHHCVSTFLLSLLQDVSESVFFTALSLVVCDLQNKWDHPVGQWWGRKS